MRIRTIGYIPVMTLVSFLAGCITANYNKDIINAVPKKTVQKLLEQAAADANLSQGLVLQVSNSRSVPYEEAVRLNEIYSNLPPIRTNLYFAEPNQTDLEARALDMTGPLNQSFDKISDLESILPENSNRFRLIMGGPDNLVSPRSEENQLSNESLIGVDTYTKGGNGEFLVCVDEITGIKNGRNNRRFNVIIKFGLNASTELELRKNRTDFLYPIESAENAAIAFAVGGPIGALGSGLESGIGGLWAYFEARNNAPDNTSIINNRNNIGLQGRTADVYGILRGAYDSGAGNVITFNYGRGIAVIYLGNNASNIRTCGDCIAFTTDYGGMKHLDSFLYRALGSATRLPARYERTETKYKEVPQSFGGGQSQDPGGNKFGGGNQGSGPSGR